MQKRTTPFIRIILIFKLYNFLVQEIQVVLSYCKHNMRLNYSLQEVMMQELSSQIIKIQVCLNLPVQLNHFPKVK